MKDEKSETGPPGAAKPDGPGNRKGGKRGGERSSRHEDGVPAATQEEQPSEDAQSRIQELESALVRATEEAKGNHDRLLRERADLENFKKRAAREREEVARHGNEAMVRDLLPMIDNLERAIDHASTGDNGQSLVDGVRLVLNGILDVLERHGVTRIAALGERFDPARHEAMEQVESDDHEPNTVVREHQRGYKLHDRLIRAALVGVSKPGTGGDDP
jgi:molecular chaperone GrpE